MKQKKKKNTSGALKKEYWIRDFLFISHQVFLIVRYYTGLNALLQTRCFSKLVDLRIKSFLSSDKYSYLSIGQIQLVVIKSLILTVIKPNIKIQ